MVYSHETLPVLRKDKTFAAPMPTLVAKVCLTPFFAGQPAFEIVEPIAANA